MSTTTWTYFNTQELQSVSLQFAQHADGTYTDFSTGYSFTVKLARTTAPTEPSLIKTTGITGFTGGVVTIDWATTDWVGLEADAAGKDYVVWVQARRDSDSKDEIFSPHRLPTLRLKASPGAVTVGAASSGLADASMIPITDAGGYYTATDVEGALREVGSSLADMLNRWNIGRGMPTGALGQTMARQDVGNGGLATLLSGRMSLMSVFLVAGQIVNNITVYSGSTAAVSPTNQWFAIYNSAGARQAVTADGLTGGWATNSAKTLTITGGWTVPTTGLYYVGIMVAASTVPTLAGSTIAFTNITSIPPILCGNDTVNTGLTTPATAPATTTISGAGAAAFFAYLT